MNIRGPSFTGLSKLPTTSQVPDGLDTVTDPRRAHGAIIEMRFLVAPWVGQILPGHTTQGTNPRTKPTYVSLHQALLGVPSNPTFGICSLYHNILSVKTFPVSHRLTDKNPDFLKFRQ